MVGKINTLSCVTNSYFCPKEIHDLPFLKGADITINGIDFASAYALKEMTPAFGFRRLSS